MVFAMAHHQSIPKAACSNFKVTKNFKQIHTFVVPDKFVLKEFCPDITVRVLVSVWRC